MSLAVGIGATTTIFTVANGLLLREIPGVTDPDRLVEIVRAEPGDTGVHPVRRALRINATDALRYE